MRARVCVRLCVGGGCFFVVGGDRHDLCLAELFLSGHRRILLLDISIVAPLLGDYITPVALPPRRLAARPLPPHPA